MDKEPIPYGRKKDVIQLERSSRVERWEYDRQSNEQVKIKKGNKKRIISRNRKRQIEFLELLMWKSLLENLILSKHIEKAEEISEAPI